VLLFAAARAEDGVAPNTLRAQLAAIESVHVDHGVLTVGFTQIASEILARLEHQYSTPTRRAPIVPIEDLRAMASWASMQGRDDLRVARDHLMLTVGYSGGLRVDDLHRARLENLELWEPGYLLRISVSKLNQSGRRPESVLLVRRDDELDPVAAIASWRELTGLENGPLLPTDIGTNASRPISKDSIVDPLQALARNAGISVRPTGHSLQRSWSTHAYEAGVDLLSISRHLRHQQIEMTKPYLQSLTPWCDNAGDVLNETGQNEH
jgi:integrase